MIKPLKVFINKEKRGTSEGITLGRRLVPIALRHYKCKRDPIVYKRGKLTMYIHIIYNDIRGCVRASTPESSKDIYISRREWIKFWAMIKWEHRGTLKCAIIGIEFIDEKIDLYATGYGETYNPTQWEEFSKICRNINPRKKFFEYNPELNEQYYPGTDFHVDHKVSLHEAFQHGWRPEQTWAKENLQILSKTQNLKKSCKPQLTIN